MLYTKLQVIWRKILHVLNNKATRLQFVIIALWIIFTIAAFAYFTKDKLVSFDEKNKLENIDYKDFSTYLTPYIESSNDNNTNEYSTSFSNNDIKTPRVIHFSKPDCDCQKFSENHIEDINKLARANGFEIQSVIINKDDIIPSTPSIAITDSSGDVIYFGPYGQGLACSQTSGYAQTMLNNYLQGYTANLVIKRAKGCYCTV